MTLQEFGKRIEQYRKARGWTVKDLGKQVGLSHASISRLENGEQNVPVQLLFALAEVFAVQPGNLVNDAEADAQALTPTMQQLMTAVCKMNDTALQHLTAFVTTVQEP